MKESVVSDLSRLPLHGMGSASVTWWGTLAFMLIEGTGFALGVAVYLYLYSLAPQWPIGAPPPGLGPGTAIAAVLLASVVPNWMVARWAKKEDLRRVRFGIDIPIAQFFAAPTVAGLTALVGDRTERAAPPPPPAIDPASERGRRRSARHRARVAS